MKIFGFSYKELKDCKGKFYKLILEKLKNEGSWKISKFGTFRLRKSKPRIVNFLGKKKYAIGERWQISFTPSLYAKRFINIDTQRSCEDISSDVVIKEEDIECYGNCKHCGCHNSDCDDEIIQDEIEEEIDDDLGDTGVDDEDEGIYDEEEIIR